MGKGKHTAEAFSLLGPAMTDKGKHEATCIMCEERPEVRLGSPVDDKALALACPGHVGYAMFKVKRHNHQQRYTVTSI